MSDESKLWSTPKFLLIAVVVSFVVMFGLNALLNEVLSLGVSGGALGAGNAVVLVVVLMPRWRWFRGVLSRQRGEGKQDE